MRTTSTEWIKYPAEEPYSSYFTRFRDRFALDIGSMRFTEREADELVELVHLRTRGRACQVGDLTVRIDPPAHSQTFDGAVLDCGVVAHGYGVCHAGPPPVEEPILEKVQRLHDDMADSRSQIARHQEAFSQQFEPGSLCFYGHQPAPTKRLTQAEAEALIPSGNMAEAHANLFQYQEPTKRLTNAEQGAMQLLAASVEPLREEVTRLRLRVAELEKKS